jgi:hypothetical protein
MLLCNALRLRRATDVKVLFTPVEPWQWVARAVVLGKLELMCGGHDVVTRVVLIISLPAVAGVLWSAMWRIVWCRVPRWRRAMSVQGRSARRPTTACPARRLVL